MKNSASSQNDTTTEPMPARKLALALLTRLLWAAAFVLPALGGQAAVVLTTLYSFGSILDNNGDSLDGATPNGLVQGSDGNLYGTTSQGGTNGWGTVFKISTNGALTSLYSFTGGNDGSAPVGGLVQGNDGYFYGTTVNGGTNGGNGTVFKISTNGVLTSLYSFTGGTDGCDPLAGLVQGSDGYFYGTTVYGGTNGDGTAFKISTNGALTTLYAFGMVTNAEGNPLDGANPQAGLVQGSDGYFYGTTYSGGTNAGVVGPQGGLGGSFGTVFRISTNGAFTSLYSFAGGSDGANPQAGLVEGSDGYFYGTTYDGGTNGYFFRGRGSSFGTVFKISANGVLTTLYDFGSITNGSDPLDGANPQAGPVQGSDGYFYGTTEYGGGPNGGNGTVFKISTNGTLTSLYSFDQDDGAWPTAGLVQGSDGNFYGTTSGGGLVGGGTVFRLTIVPEFQAVTLTNATLNLTWSTEAGGTYQLQYNSDLSSTNWINLGSPFTATGPTLSTTDSLTNALQRFYRLVLSP